MELDWFPAWFEFKPGFMYVANGDRLRIYLGIQTVAQHQSMGRIYFGDHEADLYNQEIKSKRHAYVRFDHVTTIEAYPDDREQFLNSFAGAGPLPNQYRLLANGMVKLLQGEEPDFATVIAQLQSGYARQKA